MLTIKVLDQHVRANLREHGKQARYALALAINRTLDESQLAVRGGLRQHFTLRRPTFVERLIKRERTDFATRENLVGRLGVQGNRSDLLAKFESGLTKVPTGRSLAIPVDVRRNKSDIVQRSQRPKAVLDAGKAYVVRNKASGKGVIKMRRGRGRSSREVVLYGLTPKARIVPRLGFVSTVTRTVRGRFAINYRGLLAYALRTAKR